MTELTKSVAEAILLGTSYRRQVTLQHPETAEEYTVTVRPLSDAESARVRSLTVAGMRMQGDLRAGREVPIASDLGQIVEGQARAQRQAVALALCGEESWTEEEVGRFWPSAWVDQVAQLVYQISGIEVNGVQVDSFRSLTGGSAMDRSNDKRDPAGEKPA